MKYRLLPFLPALALALSVAASAHADPRDERAPERLLFEEFPTVVAATRSALSTLDVPSSVTVLTAEDIRATGAASLEELLPWIPGLDITRLNHGASVVSMRGSPPPTSQVLVLIDGRSTYLDFLGTTGVSLLNVHPSEIERIEVVRGPGSVLWGANAFLGVIHVVTKRAAERPRGLLAAAIGNETQTVHAAAAGTAGRLGIWASGRYESLDHFDNDTFEADPLIGARGRDDTALRQKLARAEIEYTALGGTRTRLGFGRQESAGEFLLGSATSRTRGPTSYVELDVEHGPWTLQAFHRRHNFDSVQSAVLPGVLSLGIPFDFKAHTTDVELQRSLPLGDHALLVGGNLRRIVSNSDVVIGGREEELLWAAFAHDEYRISDFVTAFLGVRLDDHPKAGLNVSPRGSLVFDLGETERLRLSIARSFRLPATVLSHFEVDPIPGLVEIRGNDDLRPMKLTAFEAGLQGRLAPALDARVDLFFNRIDNQWIYRSQSCCLFGLGIRLTPDNGGNSEYWGGELGIDWRIDARHTAFAGYAFVQSNGPETGLTPRHKLNAGVRGRLLESLRYSLVAAIVSHSELDEYDDTTPLSTAMLATGAHPLDVPSRAVVDAYLGWELRPGLELGLRSRNLFHQVRRQYPLGDEIGSDLMLTLRMELW